MANLDLHHGRSSEEAPRLLAMEPWIQSARVLWIGEAAEESIEWLHRLGASRVSVVGSHLPPGLRADVYMEPDGLSAVPSQRHDLVIIQDFGARLAEEHDLMVDLERLLSADGRVVGILPADGEHVGVDMLAHCPSKSRLPYGEVIAALEARFDYVTAIAQVPLLGYLITGTGPDQSIQFDGRIADISAEPPIYHLVAGFRTVPAELAHRIATLSFDDLSDRVGRVVERISTQSESTRRDANLSLSRLEQRLEKMQTDLEQVNKDRQAAERRAKRLTRDRDSLKAELAQRDDQANDLAQAMSANTEQLDQAQADRQRLQHEIERWKTRAEGLMNSALELEARNQRLDAEIAAHKDLFIAIESEKSAWITTRSELENDAQRWQTRADEFLKRSLSLQQELDALQIVVAAERDQRANEPFAHDLASLRVDFQQMTAQAHRLQSLGSRHRREHLETLGQLRKVQAQFRQTEDLLKEAQTRLESRAKRQQDPHESQILKHVKSQLAEALRAQESLDDHSAQLNQELDRARKEVAQLNQQVAELEDLKPRVIEYEERSRSLKKQLGEAKQSADDNAKSVKRQEDELAAAQAREGLLKERSIELAEAVSNLAARVDLLERETADQVNAIALSEQKVGQLTQDLGEEKRVTKSLRQELETTRQALNERPRDTDAEVLKSQLEKVEQRYQATLEALNQQGSEVAAREQTQRSLELENQRLRASQLARKLEPSDRVVELQQRITQLDQDRQRLEGELSSLQIRHDQQSDELSALRSTEDELETLRADRTSLSREVDRLTPFEIQHSELESQNQEQRATLADLEHQLREEQRRVNEFEERLEQSKDQLNRAQQDSKDQVQAARRDWEERLAEADERAENAAQEVKTMTAELEALRLEAQRSQDTQIQIESERARLQERVEQLIAEQATVLNESTHLNEAGMSVADHAQIVAQARAIETDLREALAEAQEALIQANLERKNAEDERRHQESQASQSDAKSNRLEKQIEHVTQELEAAKIAWAEERKMLEEQHENTLQKQLARAGNVQQAQISKLESELAELHERAGTIQAQEDRILQLVEEQRLAADHAWDLAIAQRTARFAALIDRFDQVVHATVQKEAES